MIVAAATGRLSEVGTISNTEVFNMCSTSTGTLKLPDPELCQKFMEATCGCTKNDGKACSDLFSLDHHIELRAQASFFTHVELDLTLSYGINHVLNPVTYTELSR